MKPIAALTQETLEFYRNTIDVLDAGALPFLVGGSFAFERYTGIARHSKDLDLFIRREDFSRVSAALTKAGYRTELTFPHWLGKSYQGEDFVDLIYGAGNGIAVVDELWFEHSVEGSVFDREVRLIPAEEMIWSKALIMERERFDGADLAHVIHAMGEQLDWERLLVRFGQYWRVLLSHLILFGFVYPGERAKVPREVMEGLLGRLREELDGKSDSINPKVCYGPVLSRAQYLADVGTRGYADGRLQPIGRMTAEEIAHWTAAIERGD